MKINRKGAVIGAIAGAVAEGAAGAPNIPLSERVIIACIVGIIVGIVKCLNWR
ncbi:MAG: hypothetical protein J7L20_04345 [Thermoplasmata archaeon]|nr:hypothetical protein [Thermoplasmata archaeon]